jgi:hypothetical protein
MKRTLPVIGSVLLIAAMALPCIAQEQAGQPGGQQGSQSGTPELKASDMVTTTATVQDINKTKRTVTLKGEDGKTVEVKAGPNVQNFDQIKKGDQVKMAYYESAAISIRKPGDPPAATGEKDTVLAPEAGGKPGKTEIKTVQTAATVEKIDPAKREVTLKGPEGQSKTIKVKEDVKGFDRLQKGDQVVVRHTEAFAVKVEPEQQ